MHFRSLYATNIQTTKYLYAQKQPAIQYQDLVLLILTKLMNFQVTTSGNTYKLVTKIVCLLN